jgi:hypothetical protein
MPLRLDTRPTHLTCECLQQNESFDNSPRNEVLAGSLGLTLDNVVL